jgi:hypothetical protein
MSRVTKWYRPSLPLPSTAFLSKGASTTHVVGAEFWMVSHSSGDLRIIRQGGHMRKTAWILLVVSFLSTAGVHAQSSQVAHHGPQAAADTEVRRVSTRLFAPSLISEPLHLGNLPALVGRHSPTQQPTAAKKSHPGRIGAWIGLAAGIAATGLFWANSNCRYGSDSGGAIAACVGVSGGMIAGGWFVGREIGRRIEWTKP